MAQEFIDFLIDLYPKLQSNEHLQICVLQTLVETLIMICGDDGCNYLNITVGDNEKVFNFLSQII